MKGSIDLVTLIIGSSMIILLLIFATVFLAERNVSADLYAETVYSESTYQAEAAASTLLTPELSDRIGRFHLRDYSFRQGWWEREYQEVEEDLTAQEAISLSNNGQRPLPPRYNYRWRRISVSQLETLYNWVDHMSEQESYEKKCEIADNLDCSNPQEYRFETPDSIEETEIDEILGLLGVDHSTYTDFEQEDDPTYYFINEYDLRILEELLLNGEPVYEGVENSRDIIDRINQLSDLKQRESDKERWREDVVGNVTKVLDSQSDSWLFRSKASALNMEKKGTLVRSRYTVFVPSPSRDRVKAEIGVGEIKPGGRQ